MLHDTPLYLDIDAKEKVIGGSYCDSCYGQRMMMYAQSLEWLPRVPDPPEPQHACPYCSMTFTDAGLLQSHRDLRHSDVDGHTVIDNPNPVYEPDRDPAAKAQEVIQEDSKEWAKEFITPPTDTPISKAEELRKQHQKPKRSRDEKEMDVLNTLRGETFHNLPHTIASINARLGYGEDFIRRALAWFKHDKKISKEEYDEIVHPEKKAKKEGYISEDTLPQKAREELRKRREKSKK